MEEGKKKGKGEKVALVVFIVLFILSLGALGYGYCMYNDLNKEYDSMNNKCNELNKKYEEANKTIANQEEAINNTTSENDYDLFVKQMKESREKLANSKNISFYEPGDNGYITENGSFLKYGIDLTENGVLSVKKDGSNQKIEVAKDVLFYRLVYIGNGGYKSLCYVTEDGIAYTANVESALVDNTKIKLVKQKETKEIVNIISGSSMDGAQPFFVDINGKIYNYTYE